VVFALNMMGAAVDKRNPIICTEVLHKKEAFLIAMMISLLIMIHAP
jgi:uncharacterized membrane protein YraQ (UPF0718 family)